MGTRSLTYVYDGKTKLVCMYRQMDGYPTGHGAELKEFLKDIVLVNGLSMAETRKIANGMECLAAQIVAHFKDGAGSIYLMNPCKKIDAGQEYEYHISENTGKLYLIIKETHYKAPSTTIFDDYIEYFDPEKVEKQVFATNN